MYHNKQLIFAGIGSVAIVVIGLVTGTKFGHRLIYGEVHYEYVADISDPRVLVGASHNVFVGRVIGQSGPLKVSDDSSVQFQVKVIYNVKGNLGGVITVDQQDYGSESAGIAVGAVYVFSTRYNKDRGWYTISAPGYNRTLITEHNLTDDELLDVATQNDRVIALEAAYRNEALLDADIRHGMTWNSYRSRRFDANGEVIDDTVELVSAGENAESE